MSLADLSLRHRATVFFLMVVALAIGLLTYFELPRERFPELQVPMVVVAVPYPGASPADVESQILIPLERELSALAGLEKLTSVAQDGQAQATVEFTVGTDIDSSLQKVRDKVDRAQVDFPTEAEEPILEEVNFADLPILEVHMAGDVGPVVLKQLAEDLQDDIEALPGVLRANLVGGIEREVQIAVDPEKLRLFGLSLDDVVQAVQNGHVSIPGGELDLGDRSFAVRVPGEVEDPLEIGDFAVTARDGRPIFVRDVATVALGFKERQSFARIAGREAVTLQIQKRLGANIIGVIDAVKRVTTDASVRWPAGVDYTFLADQSYDIRLQIADLENSILSGLILVVIVLMFALGLRNALFVGLAIPFSMLLTFLFVGATGGTLNSVSLFALVLAVGMLVDNAVVVIENIYRHVQEGKRRRVAASEATREVGAAIVVSTLTTLGAFSPLLFWPGLIGDFMAYLPQTLSVALLMSLVVAFTINPVVSSSFMKRHEPGAGKGRFARLSRRVGDAIVERYRQILGWALDHRVLTVIGTLALFVAVVMVFGRFNPGIEFLPEVEPNQVYVELEMPSGTRLEKTDVVTRQVEGPLSEIADVDLVASSVGAGADSGGLGGGGGGQPNAARLALELVKRQERTRSSFLTLEEVRERIRDLPGVTAEAQMPEQGVESGAPLEIELTGEDFETLGKIAARVRETIADIPGLVSLNDDFESARPEVAITVDRVEASRLDLTTADVASTLRTAINGTEAATWRRGDEEIDIVVRLAPHARQALDDLRRLVLVNEAGAQIPLEAVASIERGTALTSIRHKDRVRMVIVQGEVSEPRMAEPVRSEAQRRLAEIPDLLPAGYDLQFGGQSEDEAEAAEFLSRAFLYAIIIVLALMVGKFDSFAIPMIIITSVVMSMIGVLLGLLISDLPFGIIMTGVGVISLAGIVVNNAIVLLDYGEQLYARGGLTRRELVMTTGLRRLRPVLLTAITTILGLLPLTTGVDFNFRALEFSTGSESSQYWRSMGIAVIFGLTFATFLTLVLVPVLYDVLLQIRARFGSRFGQGIEDSERDEDRQSGEDREEIGEAEVAARESIPPAPGLLGQDV